MRARVRVRVRCESESESESESGRVSVAETGRERREKRIREINRKNESER